MNTGTYKILAHSKLDAILIAGSILHACVLAGLIWAFEQSLWTLSIVLGLLYSYCITWNINSISHNFIHNPFFAWGPLNIVYSIFESMIIGFSQTFYHFVHLRHHSGNNDPKDEKGETYDWMSLFRYGKDGEVESVWGYTFLGFFRGNPVQLFRTIYKKSPSKAIQGAVEYFIFLSLAFGILIYDWQLLLFIFPFYFLGHTLSSINGYYEHFGSDSKEPYALGVSSYGRLYNLLWFNNGYHAEHHYKPGVHWTKMKDLSISIAKEMKRVGTKVLRFPQQIGFLK